MNNKMKLIASVFLFGTIGIFVNYIPLPSSVIAMSRGIVGALFLLLLALLRRDRPDLAAIRKSLPLLLLSGAVLGCNWMLLFEAYKYTGVATATLCYYLAPVFVILLSPLLFAERLTAKKLSCAAVALMGMIPVSGVLGGGEVSLVGILFGVGAACLYTCIVILNKRINGVSGSDRTLVQLAAAGLVMLPYVLLTQDMGSMTATTTQLLLLLVVCVVHTGLAYMLYLSSVNALPAQTVAIFSYIDPITAIVLSALLLHEPMGVQGIIGAVLILGATFVSEIDFRRKR